MMRRLPEFPTRRKTDPEPPILKDDDFTDEILESVFDDFHQITNVIDFAQEAQSLPALEDDSSETVAGYRKSRTNLRS